MEANGEFPTGSTLAFALTNDAFGSTFTVVGVTDGVVPSGSTKKAFWLESILGNFMLVMALVALSCTGVDFSLGDSTILVMMGLFCQYFPIGSDECPDRTEGSSPRRRGRLLRMELPKLDVFGTIPKLLGASMVGTVNVEISSFE